MKASGKSRPSLPLAVIVFLLLALPAAFGQEVKAWFARPENARNYAPIMEEALTLGAQATAAGLPDSILASRLEEGSRKHVPPEALIAALREDAARMAEISQALRARSLFPRDRKAAAAALRQALILFRAGIAENEFERTFDGAAKRMGKNDAALRRAMAALSVAASAKAEYRLGSDDILVIIDALVASDRSDDEFKALLLSISEYVKRGFPGSEAVRYAAGGFGKAWGQKSGQTGAPGQSSGQSGQSGQPADGGQGKGTPQDKDASPSEGNGNGNGGNGGPGKGAGKGGTGR